MNKILILNIEDFISMKEKLYLWKVEVPKMINNLFDRQNESANPETYLKNRKNKIYIGMISELLIQRYLNDKYPELRNYIRIEGCNDNNVDNFDISINNLTFDIKSSLEKKIINNSYETFILNNRNFILPEDQYKSKPKDYTIQILYNKDVKLTNLVYVCGVISQKELTMEKPILLRLDNGQTQLSYLKKIKNGISLDQFIENIKNQMNLQGQNNGYRNNKTTFKR